jgi:hypothetical protein
MTMAFDRVVRNGPTERPVATRTKRAAWPRAEMPRRATASVIIFRSYKIFCPGQFMGKGDNQLISSQCQLHVVDKVFSTAPPHQNQL